MSCATLACFRTLRLCALGFAIVSVAILLSLNSADARRQKPQKSRHHVGVSSSYEPPFSSIIVDGNSGGTLQANNADSPRHPASLAKIMTLYMLFERLESGKMTLDTQMDVSEHAAEQAPTKLGLRPGQTIRVEDAIKGLVTRSANDAAVVISEAIAGDEDNFAKLMTRKAHALGMSRTTYKNASGLPDDDQVTTARDQATLGRAIQDRFPRYYRYFSTNDFHFRGSVIRTHNRLLGRVEGVDGIKTGYTRASGFNLVTSMRRGNRHLIGVVMGGRSGGARDEIMRNLLAEHLERGASKRTVAAITERNPVDHKIVNANSPPTSIAGQSTTASATPHVRFALTRSDDAAQSAVPLPLPKPTAALAATRIPAQLETQPEPRSEGGSESNSVPAPLTSGVITPQLPIMPGSAEPMTPVRVKTVQIKAGPIRTASVEPATPALASTGSLPAERAEIAKTSATKTQTQKPEYVTGQGTLGAPPPSSHQHSAAMAYADPDPDPAPTALQKPHIVVTPATHLNGATKAVVRSGWMIQVGALDSESEAKQRLDAARGSAGNLLGKADPFTEKISKGGKDIYRARFAGLDKNHAEAVCRMLKRNDISCIAIKN